MIFYEKTLDMIVELYNFCWEEESIIYIIDICFNMEYKLGTKDLEFIGYL